MHADDIDCKKCQGEKRIVVIAKPTDDEKKTFILISQTAKHSWNNKTKTYNYDGRVWKEVLCPRCNGRGTELPNKNRNNSKRGKGFERRVGADFKEWWQKIEPDCDFQRTPSSGGSALAEGWGLFGDLCTNSKTFPIHIECKLEKNWGFEDFWAPKGGRLGNYIDQVIKDCPAGKIGLIVFAHPGPSQRTFAMLLMFEATRLPLLSIWNHLSKIRHAVLSNPCGGHNMSVVVLPLADLLGMPPELWRDAGITWRKFLELGALFNTNQT